MMPNAFRRSGVALASLLALSTAAPARAQNKEQCIADFDTAQDLREKLQLVAARDKLMACAREACPVALRKDCLHAIDEVTRDLPTVTLGARDAAGQDLAGLRVLVDDKPITLDGSGRSVPIDPGTHVVRFEREGFVPLRREVIVRMGERNREIVVTLEPKSSAPALALGTAPVSGGTEPSTARSRPVAGWILGGVGILGLGGFATFAVLGHEEKDRLQHLCAPGCTDSQVSALKTRYIVADVSLGVGIAALAAAAYLLLVDAPSTPPSRQGLARNIWK